MAALNSKDRFASRESRSMWKRSAAGFTLIELMIVVAIVAILAAIAYPSYQTQIQKTRRGQAKADLVEYAQLAERFHTVNNTYVGFVLPTDRSPRESVGTPYYSLALDPVSTQSTFTIVATADGRQVKDSCGDLSVNQATVKTSSKDDVASCW